LRWLWSRRNVIAALAGLGGLHVVDVSNAVPILSNGFWEMSVDKGFHLGLWTVTGALVFLALTGRD